MTIKEFCTEYSKAKTDAQKGRLLAKIKIVPYVPFVEKITLIDSLVKTTMINKDTGDVKVNSILEYLLLTRIFIEQYTDLSAETDGFFEEYDELKKSGLFKILFISDGENPPIIPYEEMEEFKFLLSKKKDDVFTNKYEIHSFIKEQVNRLKDIGEIVLPPLADSINETLNNLDDEYKKKIVEFAKKGDFKEV